MKALKIIIYIFLGLCLVGGFILASYAYQSTSPAFYMYLLCGLGVFLFDMGLLTFLYVSYEPTQKKRHLALRIISPIVTVLLLAFFTMFFSRNFPAHGAKFKEDFAALYIISITGGASALTLGILFMIFRLKNRSYPVFFITMLIAPIPTLLIVCLAYVIRFYAYIVLGVVIGIVILTFLLLGGWANGTSDSDDYDYSSSDDYVEKTYIVDEYGNESEVTDIGGGEYRDESGNVWTSDGGDTLYRYDD